LRSEIPSSMCAKLRTVAASNNRDHARNISCYCLLALHILWCYSSRTSCSWWITQSTQHHRGGCNTWHLLAQKCGPQYQTILSLQSLLLSNGNWRNTSYMKKVHNYEFYQHFTYLEQNTFSSSILYIVFTFVYICFFVFSLACAYHFFSGMKVHSIVFSVLLCFFCTSLIRFCYFFSFFSFYILFTHLHNHIKFLKSISIHSSV